MVLVNGVGWRDREDTSSGYAQALHGAAQSESAIRSHAAGTAHGKKNKMPWKDPTTDPVVSR